MPSLPDDGVKEGTVQVKVTPNIVYVSRKANMGYEQVINLPYPIFLFYLVENHIFDLQETEEGREYLEKIERLKVTTPDFAKLSKLSGYKKVGD